MVFRGASARLEFSGASAAETWRRACEDEPALSLFGGIGPEPGFSATYEHRPVGEAVVADVRAQPMHLRDAEGAPDAAPVVLIQAVVEGRPVYQGADGEIHILRAGHLIIRAADTAATIRSERFARVVTVAAPRHLLVPRYAAAADLDACSIPVEDGLAAQLLHTMMLNLDTDRVVLDHPSRFLDLVGSLAALVLARGPGGPVTLSDLAASRAAQVMAYLQRHFSNPQLDPQTLADDLSISVRYAHKLMRMTGRSFREALVILRLDAARQAFAANRRPRQTIADIAISVGFNDLSQFNRHFRGAFGMTPRAARRLDEIYGYESTPLEAVAASPKTPILVGDTRALEAERRRAGSAESSPAGGADARIILTGEVIETPGASAGKPFGKQGFRAPTERV